MGQDSNIPRWKEKPDIPRIYGNFIRANWTLFDVTLLVGQLIPEGPSATSKSAVVDPRCALTIAWAEAKYVHALLGKLLENYEKVNGPIKDLNLPDDPTSPPASEG